jgi:hypothetical protein
MSFLFIIDIFYPSGELISPYLLRCKGFAVAYHSFFLCASHLQQSQLVNNPGLNEKKYYTFSQVKSTGL